MQRASSSCFPIRPANLSRIYIKITSSTTWMPSARSTWNRRSAERFRKFWYAIMSLIDDKWRILFDKYRIEREIEKHGRFYITADQIREVKEPRLMTKFDTRESLPRVFLIFLFVLSAYKFRIYSFSDHSLRLLSCHSHHLRSCSLPSPLHLQFHPICLIFWFLPIFILFVPFSVFLQFVCYSDFWWNFVP